VEPAIATPQGLETVAEGTNPVIEYVWLLRRLHKLIRNSASLPSTAWMVTVKKHGQRTMVLTGYAISSLPISRTPEYSAGVMMRTLIVALRSAASTFMTMRGLLWATFAGWERGQRYRIQRIRMNNS
jgi:hypothetical protein